MLKIMRLKAAIVSVCLIVSTIACAQFRVIGYVPLGKDTAPDLSAIAFQRLTHLNIAFVNPDTTGILILPAGFDMLVQKAHEQNIKVLASIGGGSFKPYYANLLVDSNRSAFIAKLVKFSADHDLDGVDVDLEGDNIDKNYAPFIADLSLALRPVNKLLTAAVATWNAEKISAAALEKFDFVNIMSYDQTGPWRPDKPGPHSTYAKAEEDLVFWKNTRGLPKNKVNLGLPFYGHCFGTTYGESMPYGTIVAGFPGAGQQDMVVPESGGVIYYNGLLTIKNKTALAIKNAGGVMIWQLLQDARGEESLLTAIDNMVKGSAAKE